MITNRFELFDALRQLRCGHPLVRFSKQGYGCTLAGATIQHAFGTLERYRLIEPIDNPDGCNGIECYRIAPAGLEMETRLQQWWQAQSPLKRIALRLFG